MLLIILDERRASAEERRLIQQLSKDDYDEDHFQQQVATLQSRLSDAQRTIQSDRE